MKLANCRKNPSVKVEDDSWLQKHPPRCQPASGISPLCVKDIKETADFYEKAFGPQSRTEIKEGKDRLELLHERRPRSISRSCNTRASIGSGVPRRLDRQSITFGFQCGRHGRSKQKQIEKGRRQNSSSISANPEDDGFERKFRDPNGIVFDINWKGLASSPRTR